MVDITVDTEWVVWFGGGCVFDYHADDAHESVKSYLFFEIAIAVVVLVV